MGSMPHFLMPVAVKLSHIEENVMTYTHICTQHTAKYTYRKQNKYRIHMCTSQGLMVPSYSIWAHSVSTAHKKKKNKTLCEYSLR